MKKMRPWVNELNFGTMTLDAQVVCSWHVCKYACTSDLNDVSDIVQESIGMHMATRRIMARKA